MLVGPLIKPLNMTSVLNFKYTQISIHTDKWNISINNSFRSYKISPGKPTRSRRNQYRNKSHGQARRDLQYIDRSTFYLSLNRHDTHKLPILQFPYKILQYSHAKIPTLRKEDEELDPFCELLLP